MKYIALVTVSFCALIINANTMCSLTQQGGKNKKIDSKPRTFKMGFSAMPPRLEVELVLKTIDMWSKRGDAAIIHQSVPWKGLLNGDDPEKIIKKEPLGLVKFFRSKKHTIAITVDPLDGLDRHLEARELIEAKQSIKDPQIQKLYASYVTTLAKLTEPDYLGLAAEVNLFKEKNKDEKIYAALVEMTNSAAKDLKKAFPKLTLYVSAQVETAWGLAPSSDKGKYQGVDDIFKDYSFIDVLGLSCYGCFGWNDPDKIPVDYFSKLTKDHKIPVILVEGGWGSESNQLSKTSEEIQARWIKRLGELLDESKTLFATLTLFTDLEINKLGKGPWNEKELATVAIFSSMGLVDKDFKHKPALKEWDSIFARPYKAQQEKKQ